MSACDTSASMVNEMGWNLLREQSNCSPVCSSVPV